MNTPSDGLDSTDHGEPMRAGFVAILGAPNAGKSTLLNALVGAKLAIVTHKVQTTRSLLRGIAVHGVSQIVFVDTPGIFAAPKRRLERAMVDAAWSGAEDADVLAVLFDSQRKRIDHDTRLIVDGLKERASLREQKIVLVLNKVDTIKRDRLLELAAIFDAEAVFDRIFMVSALTGDGVKDLLDYLAAAMPEGPWLYPEDQLSDLPQRLLATETTREKLFLKLHEELPYNLTVEGESWQEFDDGSVRIEQTIYVQREGHKGIVLGKGGRTIRAVREAAQAELQELLGRPVHLFLYVKVRENWQEDPARYREMGLKFDA
jgi:GTP-binding protein Era